MKHLTIKKVALGLVLAGYVASSAIALTGTSDKVISGRAPFINGVTVWNSASADTYGTHSVDATVTRGGTALGSGVSWETGDVVELNWKTVDQDGDKEGTGKDTGLTVTFGYLKGTTWTFVSPAPADVTITAVGGTGSAKWTIPTAAIGATDIGFTIRPTTEFGLPAVNNWQKGLIDGTAGIADGGFGTTSTNPAAPQGTGGKKGEGQGPVQPSTNSFTVGIFEATVSGGVVTYGAAVTAGVSGAPNLKVLGIYAVKVMDTSVSPSVDATANFTYNWKLVEGNLAANGSATAVDVVVTGATTDKLSAAGSAINGLTYTIPVNSGSEVSSQVAGAQGFKLQVNTN